MRKIIALAMVILALAFGCGDSGGGGGDGGGGGNQPPAAPSNLRYSWVDCMNFVWDESMWTEPYQLLCYPQIQVWTLFTWKDNSDNENGFDFCYSHSCPWGTEIGLCQTEQYCLRCGGSECMNGCPCPIILNNLELVVRAGCADGVPIDIKVRAYNGAGYSDWSNSLNLTIDDFYAYCSANPP